MPFLIPVLTSTITSMITALCTQKVIEATSLMLLTYLSSKTSNTVDDKLVLMLKEAIDDKKKKA
jgi:hypothetical protein|tara:strand:+ start:424 stop:615 length:192 start_codon:yes stop_codon:yes gene_type:complete